jgi:hypothetical protein
VHFARELLAGRTPVDVGAQRAASGDFPPAVRQLLADLETGALAGAAAAMQPLAGLEDKGLDFPAADPQHGRDLLVRLAAEFEEDKRGALVGGQPVEVLDDLA